jgi:cytochrome P450
MTTDPEVYTDPDEFRPERFLDTPGGNYDLPFGFGRVSTRSCAAHLLLINLNQRFCPGQHVALQTLFISIVRYARV